MDAVYNEIAQDFSRTRYKVWTRVAAFLDALEPNTKLLEVGCGNGKNLLYRQDLCAKGLDISEDLLAICRNRGIPVAHGDARNLPEATATYDAILAIAVIHHLPTRAERQKALKEIIRVLKPGGQALISVWAWHQPAGERRHFPTQDEMVPFHTQNGVVHRYYHLYDAMDLHEDLECATRVESCDDSHNLQSLEAITDLKDSLSSLCVKESLPNSKIGWSVTNQQGNYYARVWLRQ